MKQRTENDYRNDHSKSLILILLNLGGQVVLDSSKVLNRVFHNDGNLRTHADNDMVGKVGGLGEKVEVSEGKVELDGFFHIDNDMILFVFSRGVGSGQNVSSSHGARDGEANTLLPTADSASITQHLQISDDSFKFLGGHLDGALVRSVWNSELLVINFHQLQV